MGKTIGKKIALFSLAASIMAAGLFFVLSDGQDYHEPDRTVSFSDGAEGLVFGNPDSKTGIIYFPGGDGEVGVRQQLAAKKMSERNFLVLLVDFSEISGKSEFHDDEIELAKEALAFMGSNVDKFVLLGTSHGAGIVLDVIENYMDSFSPRILGAIEISGGFDARAVCEYWMSTGKENQCAQLQDSFEKYSPLFGAEMIKVPLLIVHGSDDKTVPVNEAYKLENEMKKFGKEVDLKIFNTEGHGTSLLPMASEEIWTWLDNLER